MGKKNIWEIVGILCHLQIFPQCMLEEIDYIKIIINRLCKDVYTISQIIHCMHRGGLTAFWKALSLSMLKFTTHIPRYREGP